MIWSYRFARAEREPSGERDGWWVIYRSQHRKGEGVQMSSEDLAGRVNKVGNRWLAYFEKAEDPLVDVIHKTRNAAAEAIIEVHMGYYNIPSIGATVVHERDAEALL